LILPVVRDGRQNPGMPVMPALPLTPDDVRAVAEYIHAVLATARPQGAPPQGPPVTLDVLVGDPNAGRAYFESKCSGCHSSTRDLGGIGGRVSNPTQLQNLWVAGGVRGAVPPRLTATVTLPTGQKIEGPLARIDDFIVALTWPDGTSRSFRRIGEVPIVEIQDPREAHRRLWPSFTDKDIHDVTAYLAGLK
jgi:cytochrome c oxidase cbb3-type subunit 3